ncbi:phosphotransferase enzyme family protein [Kribbella ginsengisoli]|uniref:Aminoglycoside phosphotransferase domain-containing protein n=1 Tax=Kribbella ginsengisoli TaxID=363865 RepID=A0ABP6W6B2_9ACTN
MLVEPRLDRAALLDTLREHYGLAFEALRFIPVGWASAAYEVQADDDRYFLKLWPDGRDAAGAVARLPLVLRLHELGFRVPYPVATAEGALSASVAAGVVALFPFLAGVTPAGWPRWPLAVLDELGRTVAGLHAATSRLSVALPRERFTIPVADELRLHLSDRAVKPDRGAVMDQLERLERLQSAVRRLPTQYVLSHADLVGDNILVDDDGRISLLDWDEAHLAPPELDLAMLLHGQQPTDAEAFRRALAVYPSDVPLSEDLFAFFLLRRYLDDYTARVLRLHQDELDPAEEADARDGLRRWGSGQWVHLDRTLGLIRGALLENQRIGY